MTANVLFCFEAFQIEISQVFAAFVRYVLSMRHKIPGPASISKLLVSGVKGLMLLGVTLELTACAVEVETVSLMPKKSLTVSTVTGKYVGDFSPTQATLQVKSGYSVRSSISFGVAESEVVKSGYTIKGTVQAQ